MQNQEGAFKQDKRRPTYPKDPRPKISKGEVQAQQGTDPTKAVRGGTTHGASAPEVRPHPPVASRAHPSGGGALNAPKDGCMGISPEYSPKPSLVSYKSKGRPPHFIIKYTQEKKKSLIHIFSF